MTSILVRKHCQPVLDNAGYPMFFATVSDDRYQPLLVIYTTCGKPFANVHGVTFSRRRPTVAECEYSGVLLQQWMDRHKNAFDEYVDAYTEYHSAEAPDKDLTISEGMELRVDADSLVLTRKVKHISKVDGKERWPDVHIRFNTDATEVFEVKWGNFSLPPAELISLTVIPKSVLKAAQQFRKKHETYWQLVERFQKAKSDLLTCEI